MWYFRYFVSLTVFVLVACAPLTPSSDPLIREVSGQEAVSLMRTGAVRVLDVRSENEAQGRDVARACRIRFGPEPWSGSTRPLKLEKEEFLSRVRRCFPDQALPILVFCNAGVRSAPAAQTLAQEGYRVVLVRDGYMGNARGEGMAFYLP